MLGGLAAALAGRRRFVDANATTAEADGANTSADAMSSAGGGLGKGLLSGSMPPRDECGYAGLLNQGATCYLNSLLQSLYCSNDFRTQLFEWQFNGPAAPATASSAPSTAGDRSVTRQVSARIAALQLLACMYPPCLCCCFVLFVVVAATTAVF